MDRKNYLKFYNSEKNSYYFETKDGHEIKNFLEQVIIQHPKMLYKVSMTYAVLSDKQDLTYYKSNHFRTKNFQNISPLIEIEIENYITEKGEIYIPSDPFSISFVSTKIFILPICFENSQSPDENVEKPVIIGRNRYNLTRVSGVLESLYFKFNNKFPTNHIHIHVPQKIKMQGYNNLTDLNKAPIPDQVKLLNSIRRKGTMYTKEIKIVDYKDMDKITDKEIEENVLLYIDNGLHLISKYSLKNIDTSVREILPYNLELLTNAIYITYDTEWNVKKDNIDLNEVSDPDILTYSVVHGGEYLGSIGDFNFSSEVIFGKDCVFKFLEFVLNLHRKNRFMKIYCIAHNANKVEHVFIINAISKWYKDYENYMLEFKHVNGPKVYSFNWKGIEFRDSILFINLSLKDACDSFNLKNRKIELENGEILNIDWYKAEDKYIDYAKMDSICLMELCLKFTRFVSEIIGEKSIVNVFKFKSCGSIMKWWLTKDINSKLGWDSKDLLRLRDIVYFGGRCECFFIGDNLKFEKEKLNSCLNAISIKIDVTSSYPYSMSQESLPGKIVEVKVLDNFEELLLMLEDKRYIYFIMGKPKFKQKMKYPLIAKKDNNKLIFANFMEGDQFLCMWDFEIEAIKSNIENIKDIEIIVFERFNEIKSKIKLLFDGRKKAKEQNNKGLSTTFKLLMNSGYGSLGLNPWREVSVIAKGTKLDYLRKRRCNGLFSEGPNGFTWVTYKEFKEVNSLLFVASYITTFSRAILWTEIMKIKFEENGYPLYCDTDSIIFVDKEDKVSYYKSKYIGTELGEWKYEGNTKEWEIAGLKMYKFGKEIKYKGVKGREDQLLDVNGKLVNKVNIEVWSVGRDGKITIEKREKRMSMEYTKGYVNYNGEVSPWDH